MHDTKPSTRQPEQGWAFFVDATRLWVPAIAASLDGLPGQGLRDDRHHLDHRRRVARLRRDLRRLGLDPSPTISSKWGSSLSASLAPLWHNTCDLEARAAGREPRDLLAWCEAAEGAGARVTYLELAFDLLGYPANRARWIAFPSLDAWGVSDIEDMLRLRGRTSRAGAPVEGTGYARRRRADRNLVRYSDLPSALDPTGPPVLHVELRLQGDHLQADLRPPRGILKLCQPLVLWSFIARHVRAGAS